MKQMRDRGLPMVMPEKPFLGFSVTSVVDFIRDIETPPWVYRKKTVDSCKLENSLCLDVEGLDISVEGLNLDDL